MLTGTGCLVHVLSCPLMMPMCACSVTKLYLTLCDPWTVAHQAPLSMGFFRKNPGVGYHFLLQRVFPGIALAGRFFTTQPPGKHLMMPTGCKKVLFQSLIFGSRGLRKTEVGQSLLQVREANLDNSALWPPPAVLVARNETFN